ncbi:MAG: group 1 glycosyl transferase [Frankiales bacterium]|nr:group 1 glycosyl transferase [Frankiales bacterium]
MLRPPTPTRPLRVVLLNWRDSGHPEGGGSELYVEQVAAGLAARGHDVVLLTARYPGSAAEEVRDGYRVLRAGGRFGVYPRALLRLLGRRLGAVDVVVDVQNGMPFLSRLVTRVPVVVLCHHVHREQWPIVMGRFAARFGWAVESRLAPLLYRGCRYVTVSEQSRSDLVELGVRRADVTVVHNGTPAPLPGSGRSPAPEVLVLGRLVPHKRVEHAVRAVAALREELPGLTLTVVGSGWWEDQLREEVVRAGVADAVQLLGHVDEATKHALLARAWVCATPSVKEGWGLCAVEAAAHGTPTVAYRSAGGLAESVLDGLTGLLCDDDEAAFTAALRRLLVDDVLRARTGSAARLHAARFTWDATVDAFARVLAEVTGSAALELPLPRSEQPLPARRSTAVG